MKYLATFSGRMYHEQTQKIIEGAQGFGADKVLCYDDVWLRDCHPAYWKRMEWFRNWKNPGEAGPRGVDWFCFKSFYILHAFRRLNEGDILLAVDADTHVIADLNPLYDQCRKDGGRMFFNVLGCKNRWYTKRDVFTLMGCDEPEYHETYQAVARFILLEKGAAFPAEKFLGEWLGFTANPIINTFEDNVLGLPNYEPFYQNRCEQSVLTNLTVKYRCKLYREACQNGNGGIEDWDIFPQTFYQSGGHTYRPGYTGDESEGSAWRNVED